MRTSTGTFHLKPNSDARLLYSPADAAAIASISRSELYLLLQSGEIRSFKHGSRRLIPHTELEQWVTRKLADIGTSE